MAIDSESKRWNMLALSGNPVRTVVFNPDTSGVSAIEKTTLLQYYGGNAWDSPSGSGFQAAWAINSNVVIV